MGATGMNPDVKWLGAWLLACALGAGGALGWYFGRAPLRVQLATLATQHATEQAALALHAAAALQAAAAVGDALTADLLRQQTQIDTLKTQARHAITLTTTGALCLNEPTLRLLDRAPGLGVRDLSPATGGALAAGSRIALDTDIALWALDAGAAFAVCRARLDALIDWHTPQPTGPTGALHD